MLRKVALFVLCCGIPCLANAADLTVHKRAQSSAPELTTGSTPAPTASTRHRYCIICYNGTRSDCDAPIGGEIGRSWCGVARGISQCSGGRVDDHAC